MVACKRSTCSHLARLTPRSVYTDEYERLRRDAAHRALVIVCTGERPGMGLLNAERFRNLDHARRLRTSPHREGSAPRVEHPIPPWQRIAARRGQRVLVKAQRVGGISGRHETSLYAARAPWYGASL